MPDEPKMWVIICREHNSGAGPFGDVRAAAKAAIEASETSKEGCMYQPVPIHLVNGSQMKKITKSDYTGGQYL